MTQTQQRDVRSMPAAAVIAEIRSRNTDLVPSEARVAQIILADPAAVVLQSASELASAASTSTTTVVRCARSLGFKGYQDLRLALARTVATDEQPVPLGADTGPAALLESVALTGAGAVQRSLKALDTDALGRTIDVVRGADRVLFSAVGTAMPLALDAAYRYQHIGLHADAPQDSVMQRIAARSLKPGDVCIALSHAGSAPATVATARESQRAGATLVAITSFYNTALARMADVLLVAGSQEHSVRVEALASRLVHLTILDAIFMGVLQADPATANGHLADIQDMLERDTL